MYYVLDNANSDSEDSDEGIWTWVLEEIKRENDATKSSGQKVHVPTVSKIPLPPGYHCHWCGSTKHEIKNCPTNNNPEYDIKKLDGGGKGKPRTSLNVEPIEFKFYH